MKDINKIKELLTQASILMWENVELADNIDLYSMKNMVDDMVDDLDKIGDFEKFED
jgi:hypothetical protein